MGLDPIVLVFLLEETAEGLLYLTLCTQGLRKDHVRTKEEGSHLQAMRRFLTRYSNWQHLELGLHSFQNCEKINFYCPSHPVYWHSITGDKADEDKW